MKNTGTLRIQTFAARQSAPVEGVTVAVQGDGFTLHRITDATGSAADIPVEAPRLHPVAGRGQHHSPLRHCQPDRRKARLPHRAH